MQKLIIILFIGSLPLSAAWALRLPVRYIELLNYVQPAPDQGETNTCWFVASTGAMELLLNKKDNIRNPKANGKYDLSESFLIYQEDYFSPEIPTRHFIEDVVLRFNHGEAILNKYWPFNAFYEDGSDNQEVWNRHPKMESLPRLKVPQVQTQLLFAEGNKYSTNVLDESNLTAMKEALIKNRAPLIVNYNDDGFWHVVLIVGFDDKKAGTCYEIDDSECNKQGAFYVRDSDGKRYEARAYNWFKLKANAAAVVKFK